MIIIIIIAAVSSAAANHRYIGYILVYEYIHIYIQIYTCINLFVTTASDYIYIHVLFSI